jgi:hypothetical protein
MKTTANILLHWLVSVKGNLPRNHCFSLPARFDHQGDDWTNNAWSVVVNVDGVVDKQNNQYGTMWFLMDGAPCEWLSKGKRFTLFEGAMALAEGTII